MKTAHHQMLLNLTTILTISTAALSAAIASPLQLNSAQPQMSQLAPLRTGPSAPPEVRPMLPFRAAPAFRPQLAPSAPTPPATGGDLPIKPRGFSPRVPADVKAGVLQDLHTVQAIQGNGATPVFVKIFGGTLNGASLLQFFAQRIANFDMDACGGGTRVAACVQPNLDQHTMWLTPNYVRWNMPEISRIAIIFHESRHTEAANNFWGHVACPVPYKDAEGNDILGLISANKMAGQDACDTTPYGAYGLEAVFLKNIQMFCTNCTAKVKMDAMLFANDTYNRISDKRAQEILLKDDPTWK